MSPPIPVKIAPGVIKTDSIFSQVGRWVDSDKVRFYRGKPQKVGGNTFYAPDQFTGVCRALHAWSDFSLNSLVMVGTNCKLQVIDPSGNLIDVTPLQEVGTLGIDPFTTTIGSNLVVVQDADHGRAVGDAVTFSGSTLVGGLMMNGTWPVTAVVSTSQYSIENRLGNATSTETGGGAAVAFEYELFCGLIDAKEGGGYGIGGYGIETYGTIRTLTTYVQYPRFWTLGQYGEDMICCPTGGSLYYYDVTNQTTRVQVIANAPTLNQAVFVADSRHIVALGADGESMLVKWCDAADSTLWAAADDNSAGERRLLEGSRLINGTTLQNRVSLIWSDTACYVWQYTGSRFVFDSRVAALNCGLAGPKAFTVCHGIAYWMSRSNFYMYAGYVQEMPNSQDVQAFVMDNLDNLQGYKSFCGHIPEFNEIWFWWVLAGQTEPSFYVMFDRDSKFWTYGTMQRSAFANQENLSKFPLMAGSADDDFVYQHEDGLNNADGSAIEAYIESAPVSIANGGQVMDVWHFEPDFERQVGGLTLNLTSYENRRVASVIDNKDFTISETEDLIDTHVSGRFVQLRITSNEIDGDFRLGEPTFIADQGGSRI